MADDTTGKSATAPPPEAAATQTGDNRPVRATAKYLRFSAQKGRSVVGLIRGRRVADAYAALEFSTRGAAHDVRKVLHSAVSNAENNNGMSADDLYVESTWVDEGPTLKRWRPRARGRADRINKRTCHVTVVVSEAPDNLDRRGRAAAGGDRSARVAASKGESKPAPKADAKATASKAETKADATPDAPKKAKSAKSKSAKSKSAKSKSAKSKSAKSKSAKAKSSKSAKAKTKPTSDASDKPAADKKKDADS